MALKDSTRRNFAKALARIIGRQHPGTGWTVESGSRRPKESLRTADRGGKIESGKMEEQTRSAHRGD
jgi:hypothetical protein